MEERQNVTASADIIDLAELSHQSEIIFQIVKRATWRRLQTSPTTKNSCDCSSESAIPITILKSVHACEIEDNQYTSKVLELGLQWLETRLP